MRAGHLLLLAIGIACLALAQGSASAPYLLSSEDVAYECVPDTEIDQMYKAKEVGEEEAYRCKEFCKRIKDDVLDMEKVDKEKLEKDPEATQKGCKATALALVKLADAVNSGDLASVEKHTTAVHKGSCLAQLMSNWAARDAACHREKSASDQRDKVMNRAITILVQFYGKALGPSRRNGEVEVAGELEIEDGRRLGKKKELGKDGLDATDFCPYQVAKWVKDHKMVLFDETACDNMHPLYNDMKSCTKQCWDSMKTKLNGNGCVALYYQIMFDMAKVSKVMENADGASPTSTDDKLPAIKDDGKLNKLPPKANSGESKCKSVPCASISDAIKYCAKAGDEKDYIKWSSKVSKVDDYGRGA